MLSGQLFQLINRVNSSQRRRALRGVQSDVVCGPFCDDLGVHGGVGGRSGGVGGGVMDCLKYPHRRHPRTLRDGSEMISTFVQQGFPRRRRRGNGSLGFPSLRARVVILGPLVTCSSLHSWKAGYQTTPAIELPDDPGEVCNVTGRKVKNVTRHSRAGGRPVHDGPR